MTVNELLKSNIVLLDGGFGTELIKKGLQPDEDSVSAIFNHPQWVKEIHRSYINAGSNIIMADTFGANAFKLKGAPYTVEECVNQAIKLAKEEWKKEWGSLDDVSFNVSVQSDGKYGVTVYDTTTTQSIQFYIVDVDTGVVKEK